MLNILLPKLLMVARGVSMKPMKSHLRQPKLKALGPQPQLLIEKESEKAMKVCGSSLQPMKRANGAFKLKVQLRQPHVKISDMSVTTRIILPYQTRVATDYAIKMYHKLQSKGKGARGKADLRFDATFEVKRSVTQGAKERSQGCKASNKRISNQGESTDTTVDI